MRKLAVALLIVTATLSLASAVRAQTQITTGVIQGAISDQTGAVLPGASVEVKNLETNLSRTIVTEADGRFVFLQLPTGRYTLQAARAGYATLIQENLTLTVGQTITLNLTMRISTLEEKITITAAPTIDIARSESSTTLNETSVSTTPILGRKVEMFNTFNNKNNINPLTTPGLFNFNGFLRQGVGDPRQLQLAVRFTF